MKERQGKTFLKTADYWYWIAQSGEVTRTAMQGLKEERIKVLSIKGKAYVKIADKRRLLKRLVAECFLHDYKESHAVICRDGNEFNCRVDNLTQQTIAKIGSKTGGKARSRPIRVIYPDSSRKDYASISAAAQALYVSRTALCNYMNKAVNRSILDGFSIAPLSDKKKLAPNENCGRALLAGFPKNEKVKFV